MARQSGFKDGVTKSWFKEEGQLFLYMCRIHDEWGRSPPIPIMSGLGTPGVVHTAALADLQMGFPLLQGWQIASATVEASLEREY